MTFYNSKEWRRLVDNLKIERVNDKGLLICEYCGRPIAKRWDAIGHHVIPLNAENEKDATIALNPDNVQIIHFACHNKIHPRAEGHHEMTKRFTQEVFLVYGAPCSGKTTWVRENASESDLILDMDRLWDAVCLAGQYNKPNRLKPNVFELRDTIINQIRIRKGKWEQAFVIGGYPLASDRDRLCDMLRARPVFIDEPKETCHARAKDRPEAWHDYIEEWFESYTE